MPKVGLTRPESGMAVDRALFCPRRMSDFRTAAQPDPGPSERERARAAGRQDLAVTRRIVNFNPKSYR
jgi:hypothetical protein